MYAVIETGGKQYRVEPKDIIDIERLPALDPEEKEVVFDRVLMVGDGDDVTIGQPLVEGATVKAQSLGELRGPKVTVFKMKRRKGYRRKRGHRQNLLRVRIQEIAV